VNTITAHSFEDRLNEVLAIGNMLISGSIREDEQAAAAGLTLIGVARSEGGSEVHVFQRKVPARNLLVLDITRAAQDIADGYGSGQNSQAMLFALRDKVRDAVQADSAMKDYRYCQDRVACSLDDPGPSAQVFFERAYNQRFSSVVIIGPSAGRLSATLQLRDAQSKRSDKCYDANSQFMVSVWDQTASFSQFVAEALKEVKALEAHYENETGLRLWTMKAR
jgi:hypothetical protein